MLRTFSLNTCNQEVRQCLDWDLLTDRFAVDEGFAQVFNLDPSLGREGLSLEQVITSVHPDDRDALTTAEWPLIADGCRAHLRIFGKCQTMRDNPGGRGRGE
ncbi:hypothetical protein [Pseudomonas sp. B15(2017)]|uniref:hypothetical protein n=1 Tax=Pseudomonas sp. B15(2017) TaxID=1981744 RepID=UPI00111C6ACA|nr:hypothetical protein [Pseudomonas sp. B15(2017)]